MHPLNDETRELLRVALFLSVAIGGIILLLLTASAGID